jgi:hypothetical protein
MAHAYYNLQWQRAMEELTEQVEIENPPAVLDANVCCNFVVRLLDRRMTEVVDR